MSSQVPHSVSSRRDGFSSFKPKYLLNLSIIHPQCNRELLKQVLSSSDIQPRIFSIGCIIFNNQYLVESTMSNFLSVDMLRMVLVAYTNNLSQSSFIKNVEITS